MNLSTKKLCMSIKVNCPLQAYLNPNYSPHCVASHLRRQFENLSFVEVIVGNSSDFDARSGNSEEFTNFVPQ